MACTSLGSDRISYHNCCIAFSPKTDNGSPDDPSLEDFDRDVTTDPSVNELSGYGCTPRRTYLDSNPACDMVAILLDHGVSIYQRNRIGFTPVRLAALMGKETCARLMLAQALRSKNSCCITSLRTKEESSMAAEKSLLLMRQVGLLPLEVAVAEKNLTKLRSLLVRDKHSGTDTGEVRVEREVRGSDVSLEESDGVVTVDESLHMVVLNAQLNPMLKLLLSSTVAQRSLNGNRFGILRVFFIFLNES